jgi:hypothetical protein
MNLWRFAPQSSRPRSSQAPHNRHSEERPPWWPARRLASGEPKSSAPPARRASAYSNSKERVARSSKRGPAAPRPSVPQPPNLQHRHSRRSIDIFDPRPQPPRVKSS